MLDMSGAGEISTHHECENRLPPRLPLRGAQLSPGSRQSLRVVLRDRPMAFDNEDRL